MLQDQLETQVLSDLLVQPDQLDLLGFREQLEGLERLVRLVRQELQEVLEQPVEQDSLDQLDQQVELVHLDRQVLLDLMDFLAIQEHLATLEQPVHKASLALQEHLVCLVRPELPVQVVQWDQQEVLDSLE